MAELIAIYRTPADAGSFEEHYFGTHVPLVKKMPGFKRYEVSHRPISVLAGPSDIHLIGRVIFDDFEAMNSSLTSAEGLATALDRRLYAPDSSGVQIYVFDTRDV